MAEIPYSTFCRARDNWYAFVGTSRYPFDPEYDKLVKVSIRACQWASLEREMVEVPEESARIMTLLAGPHHHAILKAHFARKDHESSNSKHDQAKRRAPSDGEGPAR